MLSEPMTRRRIGAIAFRHLQEPKRTQRALADRLGISATLVARIETGERRPSPDLALRWAAELDADPALIFPDVTVNDDSRPEKAAVEKGRDEGTQDTG